MACEWKPSTRIHGAAFKRLEVSKRNHRREINVLYPVGDPIFIHVYSRPGGRRHMYIAVQPMSGVKLGKLPEIVDELLIDLIDENVEFKSPEEQEEILRNLLQEVVEIRECIPLGEYEPLGKRVRKNRRQLRDLPSIGI